MSSLFAHHSHHPRVQRAVIVATVIVAATLAVVVLNAAGLPSRAAAEALRSAAASSTSTAAPSGSTATTSPSDSQLITAAAPARLLAAQKTAGAAKAAATAVAEKAAAAKAAVASAANAAAAFALANRTLNVWTTGFQTQINACRGGVDVTAHYGARAVAEHWSCGGSSFPTTKGTVVTFTGLDAGTYRVIGVVAVLNAYTAKTSRIPTGYSMLLQTCRNGDSHYTEFVALQKIG